MNENTIGWIEIPVLNMERAKSFYETVFQFVISIHDLDGLVMGWFPPPKENAYGAAGSLVLHEGYIPSETKGPLVYFNTPSGDMENELSRVENAGGTIIKSKTLISKETGYMAVILDTEGNRIALYHR